MSINLSHTLVLRRASGGPQLTSRQQFTILDRMLTNALEPLQRESDAFLEWVTEILATTIKSRRRNAGEMMAACAATLTGAPNGLELLFASGLDRGHAFQFLNRVRALHKRMMVSEMALAAGDDASKHHRIIHHCRAILGHSARLSPACVSSAYWHDQAVEWRNQIVDHYLRLLFKGALVINRASGGRVEVDPTFHDAWMSAVSSVNRFRSDQGVFANFLGSSLKGTFRVAASNALGLAAPGARVQSDAALQTTVLDNAMELADTSQPHPAHDPIIMRALMVARNDPDVRAALMISDVSPVEAMRAMGLGPLARVTGEGQATLTN